jgi:hypothetical protein
VGSEMTASSVASRRRNAKANHVGIHSRLRQYRYLIASGVLISIGIAPPSAYRIKKVAMFCR